MTGFHKRAKLADKTATVIFYIIAGFFLLLLAAFTLWILFKGISAFDINYMGFGSKGIGVQLFNTIYLVLISLIISAPIGICAGVYMAEYAKSGPVTRFLRICIETLSSLPSIVVGLFGYLVFLVLIGAKWNLFAGSMAVSILSIPLIATTTEDAVRSIPSSYRESSLAIGATHWQTIAKVLLPASIPSIITGIILAAGRGFGEAAALLYTSGMSSSVNFSNWNPFSITSPLNPFRPADTLAVRIWALKTEGIEANANQIADLAAAVLIILVFAFSIGSRALGKHLEKRMTGGGNKKTKPSKPIVGSGR